MPDDARYRAACGRTLLLSDSARKNDFLVIRETLSARPACQVEEFQSKLFHHRIFESDSVLGAKASSALRDYCDSGSGWVPRRRMFCTVDR